MSVVVTTTVPFGEWATLFSGDQRLTAAFRPEGFTDGTHLLAQRGPTAFYLPGFARPE